MSHEVIMPALGMTQDTGRLVKWHKSVGEKVSQNEILMEVETDKSTMELEAGADGFVSELLSGEGEDVPVGQVIAVITADGKSTNTPKRDEQPSKDLIKTLDTPSNSDREPNQKTDHKKSTKSEYSFNDTILASPKAKVFAKKESVSLEEMRRRGVKEPYHLSDIMNFIKENEDSKHIGSVEKSNMVRKMEVGRGLFSAEAEETVFKNMLSDLGLSNNEKIIFSCFAAGAYRNALENRSSPVYVRLMDDSGGTVNLKDPDLTGFQEAIDQENLAEVNPNLIIRDISKSHINFAVSAEVDKPEIWITRKKASDLRFFVFTLAYNNHDISATIAINFLDGLVKRIMMPLYHLT